MRQIREVSRNAVLAGIVVILLVGFYFLFDPMQSSWMPQCVFHKITGFQCIGCGAQRMLHALFHGEFGNAFRANAFLFCSLPAIIFLIYVELRRKKLPLLYKKVHSLPVILTVTVLMIAWLPIRNIFGL